MTTFEAAKLRWTPKAVRSLNTRPVVLFCWHNDLAEIKKAYEDTNITVPIPKYKTEYGRVFEVPEWGKFWSNKEIKKTLKGKKVFYAIIANEDFLKRMTLNKKTEGITQNMLKTFWKDERTGIYFKDLSIEEVMLLQPPALDLYLEEKKDEYRNDYNA